MESSCACSDSDQDEFEHLERETRGHHPHGQPRSPTGHDDYNRLMAQVRQQEQLLYSDPSPAQRTRPQTPQPTSCECSDSDLDEFERLEREAGGHHPQRQHRSPTSHDDYNRLMAQVGQQEQQLYSVPPPVQRSRPQTPQPASCECSDPDLEEFERLERETGGHHPNRQHRSPTGHDDYNRLMAQVRQQEHQLYCVPPPEQRSRTQMPQPASCECADPDLEEFERLERETGGHHPQRQHRSPASHDDYNRLMAQVGRQQQQLHSVPPPTRRSRQQTEQHPRSSSLPRRPPVDQDARPPQPSRSQSRIPCVRRSRTPTQTTRIPRHPAGPPSRPPQLQSSIPQCRCPKGPGPHHTRRHPAHHAGQSGIPQPPRGAPAPQHESGRLPCPIRAPGTARPPPRPPVRFAPGPSTGAVPRRSRERPTAPPHQSSTPVQVLDVRPADPELEAEFEGMDPLEAMLMRASRHPNPTLAAALARWAPDQRSPRPDWLHRPVQMTIPHSQRHVIGGYRPRGSPIDEGAVGEERRHEDPSPPHISQPPTDQQWVPCEHRAKTPSPETCWSPGQRERLHGPIEPVPFFHSPLQAVGGYEPRGSPIDEREERWLEGPSPPHISQETIEFPPSPPMLDEWETSGHQARTPQSGAGAHVPQRRYGSPSPHHAPQESMYETSGHWDKSPPCKC